MYRKLVSYAGVLGMGFDKCKCRLSNNYTIVTIFGDFNSNCESYTVNQQPEFSLDAIKGGFQEINAIKTLQLRIRGLSK